MRTFLIIDDDRSIKADVLQKHFGNSYTVLVYRSWRTLFSAIFTEDSSSRLDLETVDLIFLDHYLDDNETFDSADFAVKNPLAEAANIARFGRSKLIGQIDRFDGEDFYRWLQTTRVGLCEKVIGVSSLVDDQRYLTRHMEKWILTSPLLFERTLEEFSTDEGEASEVTKTS